MPINRLKRRRLQYSLRSLLVFMLLANVAMAWFFPRWRAATRQREAVAAIRAMGGHVTYNYEARWDAAREAPVPARAPSGPAWARKLLGEDFFADVVCAGPPFTPIYDPLNASPITDACLEHIGRLTHVESLGLRDSHVTDAGLQNLRGLACLRELDLANTRVTDAGLRHLEKVPSLETLDLTGTQVTDAGLRQLARLPGLRYLDLCQTRVTSEGVARLQVALPCCEIIALGAGAHPRGALVRPKVEGEGRGLDSDIFRGTAAPALKLRLDGATADASDKDRNTDGLEKTPAPTPPLPWDGGGGDEHEKGRQKGDGKGGRRAY